MASPSYRRIVLDLSAVVPKTELVGRGTNPTTLSVMKATPKGTDFAFVVILDAGGDDWNLEDFGTLEFPEGANEGVWWRNDTAQPGVSVTINIGFAPVVGASFNR